jgi:apolipoprotein N-acyltransferase
VALPGGRELALIQPGIARPEPGRARGYPRELLEALLAQSRAQGGSARYVLWPEGALLEPPEDAPELVDDMRALVRGGRFSLVFGALRRLGLERRVAVFALEPQGALRAVYEKRRLVPLAEAWPAWLPLELRARLGSLSPPRPPTPGTLRAPLPFELSVCWEAAFSAQRGAGRAGTLVNLADDGWSAGTPAAALALLMARWRAVERGAWLVRTAATGISAVIAPDGRIAASLPQGASGALRAPLVDRSRRTGFERAGYTPLCSALAALLGLRLCAVRTGRAR